MHLCKSLVLALCWLSLVRSQPGSGLQSGAALRSSGVKVRVSSVRNGTGQWVTEVALGHDNSGKLQSPSWSVDVESGSSSCAGPKSPYAVKLTFITSQPISAPGYELIPGLGHYKFHTAAEHWPRAKQVCEEEGSHLVIVNSEEEAKAMMKLFTLNSNITGGTDKSVAWVGIRESEETNGKYMTVFGDTLASTGFARWHSGQPSDTSVGSYVWMAGSSGGLGDGSASPKYRFICEQKLC